MKIVKIFTDSCPLNPCGQGGIEFDDKTALIDYHVQDCCESVYADFSNLDSDIKNYDFKEIKIKPVKNGFKFGDSRRMFFVPCYNEQNGYYGDDLTIMYGAMTKKIANYRKGKPVYDYTFIPIESCDVEPKEYIM